MSPKIFAKLGLAIVFVSALALSPASAWTCDGTLTYATSDVQTNPGQSCGGSYTNTHASDDSDQCLQETNDHLTQVWGFNNVPAGNQSLIWEGHRPNNSDGDNFRFSAGYFKPDFFGVVFSGATINHPFEVQGGTKTSMGQDTPAQYNWYIYLMDTADGSHDDTVYVDFLAICTEDF